MEVVNHVNYPDDKGRIYCRRLNKVIILDSEGKFWETCQVCPMFEGDYQGEGVECRWNDTMESYSEYVSNPTKELLRVSRDIDSNKLEKYS